MIFERFRSSKLIFSAILKGLVGLWLAMSTAWLIATVVYFYILAVTDWQDQANIAKNRNETALGLHDASLSPSALLGSSGKPSSADQIGRLGSDESEDDDVLVYTFSPIPINIGESPQEKRWVSPKSSLNQLQTTTISNAMSLEHCL